MAELIDFALVLWTGVGRRKNKFNHIRQVAPICPHWMAYCSHLVNTIEPSVCGGDAVLYNYFDLDHARVTDHGVPSSAVVCPVIPSSRRF